MRELRVNPIPVKLAVVDDHPDVADAIACCVSESGCDVSLFTHPVAFLNSLDSRSFDIVISDIQMPEVDGLHLLTEVRRRSPKTDVILVSAFAEKQHAIKALKLGAYDFFEKPVGKDELSAAIRRTVAYRRLLEERNLLAERLAALEDEDAKRWGLNAFVGRSRAMRRVLKDIRSAHSAEANTVLVTGESGTGKELVARAIHFGGSRAGAPFIPINCSALPHDLAESVLFGHARGAFTGAATDRQGCFEVAEGGTLFLDEIGDMSWSIQAKLLRVLEDGVVTRVGETKGRRLDVRVIAATNADLDAKMHMGDFRADLFFRLSRFAIHSPPLRERLLDIEALARHFVRVLATNMGKPIPTLAPDAIRKLNGYLWPGNVRELRNVLERALIETSEEVLRAYHITLHEPPKREWVARRYALEGVEANLDGIPLNVKEAERCLMRHALMLTDGHVGEAAKRLGISRAKLYRKLPELERTGWIVPKGDKVSG